MTAEPTLARLAAALADDLPIDWDEELARASSPHARALIEQVRVVSSLAEAHDRAAQSDPAAHESVGAPPPSGGAPPISRWGHLDILEPLAGGASGSVYRAWDRRLARQVALKLLTAQEAEGEQLAEARVLAQLRHPFVVTVFGADRIGGRVGLWMELVEGRTLEDIVSREGTFSARETATIVQDVCAALAAVHRAGLLHRDVKAQNIMRERGGRIVLMDFGAGRHHSTTIRTGTIDLSGTPLYMAPELFAGERASVRSDIYSLGVLLFRLVTASYPVEATTLSEVREAHQSGTRRQLRDLRPDLEEDFIDVIERALEPLPDRRFDSAASLARALAQVSHDHRSDVVITTDKRAAKRSSTVPIAILVTALTTAATTLIVERGPRELWTRLAGMAVATPAPPASAASEPRDAPGVGMSEGQRDLVVGFEELAGALGARSDWERAAATYDQIRAVHRDSIGEFAPVSALNIARGAWARHRAGKLGEAQYLYEEALVKQETTLGKTHPYTATTMGALAMLHYEAGRVRDAEAWLNRALGVRRTALGVMPPETGTLTLPSVNAPSFVKGMSRERLLSDDDGDGLLPLIEMAIGLDPNRRDSDEDEVADGDEPANATQGAISNCLLYCLGIDPTKVIAHYGSTNPRREGFFQHYPFEGVPAKPDAEATWTLRTGPLGYYFHKLTGAQKLAAVESGWRLTLRGNVQKGIGYGVVDLTPISGRWDINLLLRPPGLTANLPTSVVPWEGPEFTVDAPLTRPPLELVWAPATRHVAFYMNGVLKAREHPGLRQFQDDRGLIFGAGHRTAGSDGASADFVLVWLDIR